MYVCVCVCVSYLRHFLQKVSTVDHPPSEIVSNLLTQKLAQFH